MRGESGISCPDNIETKTAISAGVDVIHSHHYCHPPPTTTEPVDHYYAPTTIMAPLNRNWCEQSGENTKNCHTDKGEQILVSVESHSQHISSLLKTRDPGAGAD